MKPIRIDHVSKTYGVGSTAVQALTDVSLTVGEGEFVFLLGPSGCGKTTLLRIIAGMIEPTAGHIWLGERDITRDPPERRGTAMVFQNYALWPHMSIYQNVEFAPRMQGVRRRERRQRADAQLQRVQMEGFGRRKPNQLSGGQQQRVALARALAADGDCLLLDEPLSNLDARLRLHMRAELRQLVKASGATAVYVTHDQKEALSMSDRIAVMQDGRIVQVGTPDEVYNRPANRFVADFIGEANFLAGEVLDVGDPPLLRTAAGDVQAAGQPARLDSSRLRCGQQVSLCVRPEWIRMHPSNAPADPEANELPSTVEHQMYLGELRQYTCRLADGNAWRVSVLGRQNATFETGQAVLLRFRANDTCLLPD